MTDPTIMVALGSFGILALSMMLMAALKGWQGWLELKRLELAGRNLPEGKSPAIERIEMADLKERIRKLEAIAACVDL